MGARSLGRGSPVPVPSTGQPVAVGGGGGEVATGAGAFFYLKVRAALSNAVTGVVPSLIDRATSWLPFASTTCMSCSCGDEIQGLPAVSGSQLPGLLAGCPPQVSLGSQVFRTKMRWLAIEELGQVGWGGVQGGGHWPQALWVVHINCCPSTRKQQGSAGMPSSCCIQLCGTTYGLQVRMPTTTFFFTVTRPLTELQVTLRLFVTPSKK
jgi:hypothetical protein